MLVFPNNKLPRKEFLMDKYTYNAARLMLDKFLESQPNATEKKSSTLSGSEAAKFCTDFIEHYANWIQNESKSRE